MNISMICDDVRYMPYLQGLPWGRTLSRSQGPVNHEILSLTSVWALAAKQASSFFAVIMSWLTTSVRVIERSAHYYSKGVCSGSGNRAGVNWSREKSSLGMSTAAGSKEHYDIFRNPYTNKGAEYYNAHCIPHLTWLI